MRILTTKTFDKLFKKLDTKIQIKAAEKTELFKENPFNPILKTENCILKVTIFGAFESITIIASFSNLLKMMLLNSGSSGIIIKFTIILSFSINNFKYRLAD